MANVPPADPAGAGARQWQRENTDRGPPVTRRPLSQKSMCPLEALFYHLALPPKLPQCQDPNQEAVEATLFAIAVEAAASISGSLAGPDSPERVRIVWDELGAGLADSRDIHVGGRLERTALLGKLRALGDSAAGFLAIHIEKQNVGLLLYRSRTDPEFRDCVVFESFEASARNHDVLAVRSALQWDFPGTAAAVPLSTFKDEKFVLSLSSFLEHASFEAPKDFAAQTFKANAAVFEYRDTVDPALISSMLMAILEENGRKIPPVLLRKRVRDDVCWHNAEKPWRRLPLWLVLRVCTERYLSIRLDGQVGRMQYKVFIAVILSRLLGSVLQDRINITLEQISFLKTKLCRRLAKLDVDRQCITDRSMEGAHVQHIFSQVVPGLEHCIESACRHVESVWTDYRKRSIRSIPPLPRQASICETNLCLRTSMPYLRDVLSEWKSRKPGIQGRLNGRSFSIAEAAEGNKDKLAFEYLGLARKEADLRNACLSYRTPFRPSFTIAVASDMIAAYLKLGLQAYVGNSEQLSVMILMVMETWSIADELACEAYPLLRQFHPVFYPEMMDCLLLSSFEEMERVHGVQLYLRDRIAMCGITRRSIFDDPQQGCFAQLWFDQGAESDCARDVEERITTAARKKRESKEVEWRDKMDQYRTLSYQIDRSTCIWISEAFGTGQKHDRKCPRCAMKCQLESLSIRIYEHALPADPIMAKAVCFELICPQDFASYRDISWTILDNLACPFPEEGSVPRCFLREYAEVRRFANETRQSFGLASNAKSFLGSHYATLALPVDWEDGTGGVCRPNGLRLAYYDRDSRRWAGRVRPRPRFAHHVRLDVPASSPFSKIFKNGPAACPLTPTSYEVMASQALCPEGLNPHEHLAFQSLLSGHARRWPALLIELGSANLSFSNEATMLLINHIALECGPLGSGGDPLRACHSIFHQKYFCEKLLEMLSGKLDGLVTNWRETHQMDSVIVLLMRTVLLTKAARHPGLSKTALDLLGKARDTCWRWVKILRDELYCSRDAEASQRCQQYALWAALLCKRTFAVYLHLTDLPSESFQIRPYVQCSVTLHDNLPAKISALPKTLQRSIVRDWKMSYDLQSLVRREIFARPAEFGAVMQDTWSDSDNARIVRGMKFVKPTWLACDIQGRDSDELDQQILYDYVLGTLLVNGQSIGKLPKTVRNSIVMEELFGELAIFTYPSYRAGMQHRLCVQPCGFVIHVGYNSRLDETILQAVAPHPHPSEPSRPRKVFQFVRRTHFMTERTYDLPGPLVFGCFHWLDPKHGRVYIIKDGGQVSKNTKWPTEKSLRGAWCLDLHSRTCSRPKQNPRDLGGYETVIEPACPLFVRVCRIFQGFELPNSILVTQPPGRHLEVFLPRMQLLFFVQDNHLLYSPRLQCEIDPNQDAGTWYGLGSMIVCRSANNPERRTILATLGDLETARDGPHVLVKSLDHGGGFGRFSINKDLGRIDCVSEPVLVYMKAVLHAYTSSVLPDPLTGKTGTEEAIQWLHSGLCHPWTVLSPGSLEKLEAIARLSPTREYYPESLRSMKTDGWNPQLTSTIQHDAFRLVVERIVETSKQLAVFSAPTQAEYALPLAGPVFLRSRALTRRRLYERPLDVDVDGVDDESAICDADAHYDSRDRPCSGSQRRRNVLAVAHALRTWPATLNTTNELAERLSTRPTIAGYSKPFDMVPLSDRLRLDVLEYWGPLASFCRATTNKYALMFFLAPIVFRADVDVPLVQSLVAFSIFEELRTVALPQWPEYVHFKPSQVPNLDYLVKLIEPHHFPAPPHELDDLEELASAKQKKKVRDQKRVFEARAAEDGRHLAQHLLKQWPCAEPVADDPGRMPLVDVDAALAVVKPEWLRLFQNNELSDHVRVVQKILDARSTKVEYVLPLITDSEDAFPERIRGGEVVCLPELMRNPFALSILPAPTITRGVGGSGGIGPTMRERSLGLPPRDARDFFRGISGREQHVWQGPHHAINQSGPKGDLAHSLPELQRIVQALASSKSAVRRRYAEDLNFSICAFENIRRQQSNQGRGGQEQLSTRKRVEMDLVVARREVETLRSSILASLATSREDLSGKRIKWLQDGNLWPICSTTSLLGLLRSTARHTHFGTNMKAALIRLGMAITELQRNVRLKNLDAKKDTGRFADEAANRGHSNWNPENYPDWLLLEIEADLAIRPEQVDVALATMSPASGSNSVLQMNMGQGKTSCIIPMIALALANRKNLVRVVVPKALLQQTAQTLHSRFGGLLDRVMMHAPYSRRTPTDAATTRLFLTLHKKVWKSAGIVLCQPEHNLSFMLSGIQRLLDAKLEEARPMIRVHEWLTSICRDILDESDYTLAVRTQLIYPSGSQMVLDGHPHRWLVAQSLLRLVDLQLYDLAMAYPYSIDVIRREGGGFPFVFFLRYDVEDELISRVTADVCKGHGGIIPISMLQPSERLAVKDLISSARPRDQSTKIVRKLCPDRPHVKQTVYLLRGLLVNRILMMTLKKRWNVQYGLHPARDPIAVPFHAKGVPSDQSEWGHPDVAILFTCLAFYYDGINREQLRQCLEHVLKSDDPSAEYDRWVQCCESFPGSLRAWNAINVDDGLQLGEIWVATRHSITVIDYFLNNFVFPCHAKQFKVKLQSNGWDVPLFPVKPAAEMAGKGYKPLTSGFSGTNDNRTMLPLNIRQDDLSGLSHTNAEVLTYLLHPRSRACVIMVNPNNHKRMTEEDLLHDLRNRNIKILIDSGAQVLEMDNLSLARAWLRIDCKALAALYFDESNRPFIVDKRDKRTPLLASSFSEDLSQCLVYLDEAHTRGTDLKFPPNACGALTLGLGQTKDHTVQAAMRLRQLGTTQSVTFFLPPEVQQSICDLRGGTYSAIDSGDVIHWLLDNTCDGIEQLQPLYYAQGMDFCRRMQAALDNSKFLEDQAQLEKYISAVKQDEQQTLQSLYEPKSRNMRPHKFETRDPMLKGFLGELKARRKTFQDNGCAVHASALQEVEQEREVAFEVETVRRIEKPRYYTALTFPGLHRGLDTFARTGRLPANSHRFLHVVESISKTTLGKRYAVGQWCGRESGLLLSPEFDRTVKLNIDLGNDTFMRPVNWVLWSKISEIAIVIIPEEAEFIIPIVLGAGNKSPTHVLTYSAPITRKMSQFNNLSFFNMPRLPDTWTVPGWLRLELGILSGRLYFTWDEYLPLCEYLGIDSESPALGNDEELLPLTETLDSAIVGAPCGPSSDPADGEPHVPSPGKPPGRSHGPAASKRIFASKPLTFVQEWLAVRRRGHDFVNTPMGFLAQGKVLQADHPFFRTSLHRSGHASDSREFHLVSQAFEDETNDSHDGDEEYGGLDDMGVNLVVDLSVAEGKIEYSPEEMDVLEKSNSSSRWGDDDGGSEESSTDGWA